MLCGCVTALTPGNMSKNVWAKFESVLNYLHVPCCSNNNRVCWYVMLPTNTIANMYCGGISASDCNRWWCVYLLCVRWMVCGGISASTARRSLKSRATSCDTFAYTRMRSRTNAFTVSDHSLWRALWQHTRRHTPVSKTSSVKSVRSCSRLRAASRSISGYTPVGVLV